MKAVGRQICASAPSQVPGRGVESRHIIMSMEIRCKTQKLEIPYRHAIYVALKLNQKVFNIHEITTCCKFLYILDIIIID